ncbi:MAG: AAA family ATPase [Acidobacteriota bacterium]|nr:AAA family ATPase [Acidobacteriota bacterium]
MDLETLIVPVTSPGANFMYTESFGLTKKPFSLTPDPAFLFLTEQHREALVGLTSAILQRKGFVVLTGDAGTGKTTLLTRVLNFLPPSQLQFSAILNTTLTPSEFLESVLLDFGVKDVPASKALRLWKLKELLLQGQRDGKVSALIVDEAHNLSPELLEEIRMLGNFEEPEQKSLQILLVGQTELDKTLNRQDLRQLKQRISVRLSLSPLADAQVGEYIRHRWVRAGGTEHPFAPEAVEYIAQVSRGLPRVINGLCDHALAAAFEERSSRVVDRHVRKAAQELDLGEVPYRFIAVKPRPVAVTAPASEGTSPEGASPEGTSAQGTPRQGAAVNAPGGDLWSAHLANVYTMSLKSRTPERRSRWARWTKWMGRLRFPTRHERT